MEKVFINKILTKAINDYLYCQNNKDDIKNKSFLVTIMDTLVYIYSKDELLEPFYENNEDKFYNVLKKYGLHIDDVLKFRDALVEFDKNNDMDSYVFIETKLVDMFICKYKKLKLKNKDIDEFKDILSKSLYLDFIMFDIKYPILHYLDSKIDQINNTKVAKGKVILSIEAYEALGYTFNEIKAMNASSLEDVNKQIYEHFNIKESDVNKDYLLQQAIIKERWSKQKKAYNKGHINLLFIIALIIIVLLGVALLAIKLI